MCFETKIIIKLQSIRGNWKRKQTSGFTLTNTITGK